MKQGWEIKRLDDIIESNVIGLTKNSSEQDTHHNFKYVKMNNITRDNRFDLSKYTCVNATKLETEKYSLSDGDFLFNTRNSYELVGKTCLFEGFNNEVILYNNNIMRIRFIKKINPFFINYAFSTEDLIKKIDRLKSGTTNVSAIYYKDLKNLELLVPPLPEQQRIVSILDEAFAAISKAKANAEQNLKNAKELFQSYLQGVFENKGEGWEEKTIDEIIESNIIGLTKNSTEQRSDYEYKYVKMNNITRDNRFDLTKFTCVNATKLEAEKYSLLKGDFLFNTRNSYELVGKTCLFDGYEDEVILFNNNIMRIRFIKTINSHFINYSFTTKSIIKKLEGLKSGTTNVSAIYYKDLKNLKLLIPPINQQKIIVKKLDALSTETKKLEAIYNQKLNDLEELKKSVLQKAFSGQLKTAKALV